MPTRRPRRVSLTSTFPTCASGLVFVAPAARPVFVATHDELKELAAAIGGTLVIRRIYSSRNLETKTCVRLARAAESAP
jgi:hypothetical protein